MLLKTVSVTYCITYCIVYSTKIGAFVTPILGSVAGESDYADGAQRGTLPDRFESRIIPDNGYAPVYNAPLRHGFSRDRQRRPRAALHGTDIAADPCSQPLICLREAWVFTLIY